MENGINEFQKNKHESNDLNNIVGQIALPIFMKYFYTSNNQLFSFLMLTLIIYSYKQRAHLIKDLKHLQII